MAEPIEIELIFVEPIYLEFDIEPVHYIGTSQAGPRGEKGEPGYLSADALLASNRLSEFDTAQKKHDARENLELNMIDGGTFY